MERRDKESHRIGRKGVSKMLYCLLQKGQYYGVVNEKNAVSKTSDVNLASRFPNRDKALELLERASKKLEGFQIVEVGDGPMEEETESVNAKRRQFLASERAVIYNRNKGRCALCGRFLPCNAFTIDHIVPLAKGGTNELDNLQCTCKTCNLIKHDILMKDLTKKLSEIVLYQMRRNFDEKLWQRMRHLKKKQRRARVARTAKAWMQKDV